MKPVVTTTDSPQSALALNALLRDVGQSTLAPPNVASVVSQQRASTVTTAIGSCATLDSTAHSIALSLSPKLSTVSRASTEASNACNNTLLIVRRIRVSSNQIAVAEGTLTTLLMPSSSCRRRSSSSLTATTIDIADNSTAVAAVATSWQHMRPLDIAKSASLSTIRLAVQ
eukprot:21527-Heterococcus_DN1.PRE.3